MYMHGLFCKLKTTPGNYPLLITVVLLLFKLKNKKEVIKRLSLNGVPSGVINDNIPILI